MISLQENKVEKRIFVWMFLCCLAIFYIGCEVDDTKK